MNFPYITKLVGAVLLILSVFMLIPLGISLVMSQSDVMAFVFAEVSTLCAGLLLFLSTRRRANGGVRHRDVFGVVTFSWLTVSFFGALPYLFSGSLSSFTHSYFEAMAGFTTTGATVIGDIESLSGGVLFWRSLTQWLGGMGIILFALTILPFVGSGGMQLFRAEAPELTVDKLRPRIIDTAKSLWYIYASLTAIAALLYLAGGMSVFDSLCHAFTTLSTGGFSTKNTSIAYYQSSYIDGVCTLFMFLAGINYSLYYYGMRGDLGRFLRSSEFRFYLSIVALSVVMVTLSTVGSSYTSLSESVRHAAFQVVSIMTTTGYATQDYEQWSSFSQTLLVMLMFFGGMIGSTSGGMKQVRVLLMLKQGYRELYQLIHPRAVTTLKLDGKHITKELLGSIWGFLFLFLFICVIGTLAMTALGVDVVTASSTVLSATSNVGPALGEAGPTENYRGLPFLGKWILIFCMLAGRLEIYTVVILFVPRFWKK
jgi:trk system potassium uptake protein TrkH